MPEMTPKTTLIEKISMEMQVMTERYLYILHNRPKEFVFLPVAAWPQWPQFGADHHGFDACASETSRPENVASATETYHHDEREATAWYDSGLSLIHI